MKKIIKKMEELSVMIEEETQKREETFDSRSERWQESEKGETFKETTDWLNDKLNELKDWVFELTESTI